MRSSVRRTFDWQRQWLPKVRRILGPRLLREGTLSEDRNEATDLIVLVTEASFRIACRLRTPGYAEKYPFDLTVTCRRETGFDCEWHKMILGGLGSWFFYGHATHADNRLGRIRPWWIVELSEAREWMLRNHGPERGPNRDRKGERCWFYAFDTRRMVAELGARVFVDALWPEEQPSLQRFGGT